MRDPSSPRCATTSPRSAPTTTRTPRPLAGAGRRAVPRGGRPDTPAGPRTRSRWPLSGFIYRTRMPEGSRESTVPQGAQPGESAEQLLLDENIVGAAHRVRRRRRPRAEPGRRAARLVRGHQRRRDLPSCGSRTWRTGEDLPDLIERTCPGSRLERPTRGTSSTWCPTSCTGRIRCGGTRSAPLPAPTCWCMTEEDARFELSCAPRAAVSSRSSRSASRDTTEVAADPAGRSAEREPGRWSTPRRRGVEYRVDHASGPDWR